MYWFNIILSNLSYWVHGCHTIGMFVGSGFAEYLLNIRRVFGAMVPPNIPNVSRICPEYSGCSGMFTRFGYSKLKNDLEVSFRRFVGLFPRISLKYSGTFLEYIPNIWSYGSPNLPNIWIIFSIFGIFGQIPLPTNIPMV